MKPIARSFCNWDSVHRVLDAVDGVPNLPAGAVTILVVIARHINPQTGIAYASAETFRTEGHVPPRTSARAINALVDREFIERISGGLPNRSNQYRLGKNVPEFVVTEKATNPKKPNQQAAAPPTTSRINSLLNYQ